MQIMKIYIFCNMNAFFSLDDFMVYIPECRQQLRHTLNLVCSFITLREPITNYLIQCHVTCLLVQHLYYHLLVNKAEKFLNTIDLLHIFRLDSNIIFYIHFNRSYFPLIWAKFNEYVIFIPLFSELNG